MSQKLLELHKRNQLMLWIYLGALIMGIGASYQKPHTIAVIATYGIPIAAICAVVIWRKIAIPYVMYVIAIGLGVISFFTINESDRYGDVLILYFSLALISLYHNYRPLVVSGAISLGLVNYFYAVKPIFQEQDALGMNTYIVLTVGVLIAQSLIGDKMMQKAEASAEESSAAKEQSEQLLQEVVGSIDILGRSTSSLQSNAADTGEISKQVVTAFHEIAGGVDSQASTFTEISEAMQRVNDSVRTATEASVSMSQKSRDTATITLQGQEKMEELSGKINEINDMVARTSQVMAEVTAENEKIGNIVGMIGEIANQTNLLSLNASIEAARAGEHGQGFSVVATEIRKLAQHAHDASSEISVILGSIQSRVELAAGLVQDGLHTVSTGRESASSVEQLFAGIHTNTAEVLEQAETIRNMNEQLQQSSQTVLDEITTAAAFTEQSAASIQEVLASADVQQRHVGDIVDNIQQLSDLMGKLDRIVKQ